MAGEDNEQEKRAREGRGTGGDAPAAASIEEREALAEDRDQLFDGDEAAAATEDEEPVGRAPDAPRSEGDIPDESAAVEPPG